MADGFKGGIQALVQAILLLKTPEEVESFLKDLCTPCELDNLCERWSICLYLDQGLSYREIHEKTGSSLTTITRVARFLKDEPYKGYVHILQQLKKGEKNGQKIVA